jgi:DNA-binding HxlR family transcriptional regulator
MDTSDVEAEPVPSRWGSLKRTRVHSMTQPTSLVFVERKSFADMHCSVAQCLEVVGEWWSMLIVRDAFLGVTRFDDFRERLGISRNILNQRLSHLVEAGVLAKVPYSEHPPRYDYRLTDKGRDLWPVLTAMRQWGDRYEAPHGPPIQVTHKSCGHVTDAVMVCSACGERIGARDVRADPGPGAVESLIGAPKA